jgi:phosphoenolpyruvate carboxykinase (GTP)
VDTEGWKRALPQIRAHYARFGERLPAALTDQLERLAATL